MRSTKPMPDPADAPRCPDVPTAPPDAATALSDGRTGPSWSTADVADAAAALYRAEWRSADDPDWPDLPTHDQDSYRAVMAKVLDALAARGWRPEWQTLRHLADERERSTRASWGLGSRVSLPDAKITVSELRQRADEAEKQAGRSPSPAPSPAQSRTGTAPAVSAPATPGRST